jgi:hypothetical protein
MIEKKDTNNQDPNNYRPISLTNCIPKIIEKLVNKRLNDFLDKHNLIHSHQSGFRKNRQTVDNLLFFLQKVLEAFENNQKVCGIVFDIKKAFDKVWHKGLFFKMNKMKIPKKIGLWIKNFLTNRKFRIKVGDMLSDLFDILCSVPQGSILSPNLFKIYINDIFELSKFPNDKILNLLFADDKFSFNIDINLRRLLHQMNRYLKSLEVWLNEWRMSIAANKCSFTIYSKITPKMLTNGEFKLEIYGQPIPINHSPRYLGVLIDNKLNLNNHIENVKEKCLKKLNVLKCLSYKNWSLCTNQQLTVYKCLIRATMEYAPIITLTSEYNVNKLSGIQYQALKIISKERGPVSNTYLHDLYGIETFDLRLHDLSSKYIENAFKRQNPLISDLLNNPFFTSKFLRSPFNLIGFIDQIT